MKKVLYWIIGIIIVLCAAVACIWFGEISTLGTIKSVGGNEYLYRMEYKATLDLRNWNDYDNPVHFSLNP